MANGFALAVQDIRDGTRLSPLWLRLGWEQTISRFRRTLLGPFWMATSLLATAFALAFVFGGSGDAYRKTFPYIISGILCWGIVGPPVTDGAGVFLGAAGLMQMKRLPLSFHVFLNLVRMMVNFIAQILAYWAVLLLFRLAAVPSWEFVPGLAVVLVNGFLISLVVGLPSTRFRDVGFLMGFIMQLLFFLTPVFWVPDLQHISPIRRALIEYNPLYHMLELIRQPLMGHSPAMEHWIWGFGWMAALGVIALVSLTLFRKRVVFWL